MANPIQLVPSLEISPVIPEENRQEAPVTVEPETDESVSGLSLEASVADFSGGVLGTGIKPVTLEENQIGDTFSRWGKAAPAVIASMVVDEITSQPGAEDLMTFQSLQDGTAPYFDLNPETKNLAPAERRLEVSDIVKEFSNAEDRGFFEQLALESPRVFLGLSGGFAGAKTGVKVAKVVSKLGSPGRIASPFVLGGFTAAGAYLGPTFLEDLVKQQFFGEISPYTPRSRMNVVFGQATADALEGIGGLSLLAASLKKTGKPDLGYDALAMLKGFSDLAKDSDIPKSARFLRGAEQLIGKPAVLAATNPGKTALAETTIGGLGVAGAAAAESIDPGSPTSRLIGQTAVPLAGTTLYTLSPIRFILSNTFRVAKGTISKENFVQSELAKQVPLFEAAKQKNPAVDPADFNLKVKGDGEYELEKIPGIVKRTGINLLDTARTYREGRKAKGAQFIIDDMRRRLSEQGLEAPEIEAEIQRIVQSFRSGENIELFNNDSFNSVRQMLRRSGTVFAEQGEQAKEDVASRVGQALTGKDDESVDRLADVAELALLSGTEDGYLIASDLSKSVYGAAIQAALAERAGKVFAAYKNVLGDNMGADDAAAALYRALDPIIEATRDTAGKLYSGFPSHKILFDAEEAPQIVRALDEIEGLPTGPKVKGLLPQELRVAIDTVEEIKANHAAFKQGVPSLETLLKNDAQLQKASKKFDDLLDKSGASSKEQYDRNLERLYKNYGADAFDHSVQKLNDFISTNYGGRFGAKGPVANRTKALLEAQRDLLLEKAAATERARDAASATVGPDNGFGIDDIRDIRKRLLAFARKPDADRDDRRMALEMSEFFEKQLLDEKVTRDVPAAEVEEFIAKRMSANAYYRARQNIFNDGVFKEMAKRTPQGADQSVEVLRDKMETFGKPLHSRIEDIQRAVRFSFDPIETPSLRPGALEAQDAPDLSRYSSQIMDGLEKPNKGVPSAAALERQILNDIEANIVANRKAAGVGRDVVDPEGMDLSDADEIKKLGLNKAEVNAITKALENSENNGLDLLPDLKQRLTSLRDSGADFVTFPKTVADETKKFEAQNLWYAMSKGGPDADFNVIMSRAYGLNNKATVGIAPIYNNLLAPIKQIEERAKKDPVALLKALRDEVKVSGLQNVDIDALDPQDVERYVGEMKETAQEGLKSIIIGYAQSASGFDAARTAGQQSPRSFAKLDDILFNPPPTRPGQRVRMPSLVDWMKQNNLMTSDQAQNLKNSLSRYKALDDSISKQLAGVELDETDPVVKALVSVFGSAVGGGTYRLISRATGGLLGGSGSITATGVGAQTARNVLINARAAQVTDGLISLMQDKPQEIARLLALAQKGSNPKAVITKGDVQNLLAVLAQMQVISVPRTTAIRLREEEPTTGVRERKSYEPPEQIRRIVDPRGEKPPIGDQSSVQVPQFKPLAQRLTEAAPAPAPRPTGQPNPKQRQGLATLFPNDPILGAGRNVG